MGLENVNRCQHIKMNGTQCGSPALRRRRLCFFHGRCHEQRARIAASEFKQARFVVPVLEDANAVQMALMQVMQLLSTGQMDHKTAGLMLYALQTASCNLRNTNFEADEVTDVVIDCGTVNATCIGGPQWVEEDFEDEAEETEDEEMQAAGAEEEEEVTEEEGIVEEKKGKVRAEKAVGHVSLLEARKQVQGLARDWVFETGEAEAESRPG
ncbi:MAG: hypothetical protein ACYDDS_21170 [Candidatus Sulfotelmatobacter sp.]